MTNSENANREREKQHPVVGESFGDARLIASMSDGIQDIATFNVADYSCYTNIRSGSFNKAGPWPDPIQHSQFTIHNS
jgi:hypothetical protein